MFKENDVCKHWFEDNPNDIEMEICKATGRRTRCCGQKDRCRYPEHLKTMYEN